MLRRVLLAVALAATASGACGESDSSTSGGAATATTAGTGTSAVTSRPGDQGLLAFTAPRVGGGEVDATAYQGRPTLVWFWAPW